MLNRLCSCFKKFEFFNDKSFEFRKTLYCCCSCWIYGKPTRTKYRKCQEFFLDLLKAFDTIDQSLLLKKKRLTGCIVTAILGSWNTYLVDNNGPTARRNFRLEDDNAWCFSGIKVRCTSFSITYNWISQSLKLPDMCFFCWWHKCFWFESNDWKQSFWFDEIL